MKIPNYILLIHFTFIILVVDACKDPDNCPQRFHVPAEVIPYKKVYSIGDTIRIISKFYKLVYEEQTDRTYVMDNIKWHPNTGISFLDTIGYSNISNYFDVILSENYKEINSSEGYSTLIGQYTFIKDTYLLEFIIIPKQLGNFYLAQLCGVGSRFGNFNFPGKCHNIEPSVIVDMNSGKDNNIEIMSLSLDPYFKKINANSEKWAFSDKGGFCFTVVP